MNRNDGSVHTKIVFCLINANTFFPNKILIVQILQRLVLPFRM